MILCPRWPYYMLCQDFSQAQYIHCTYLLSIIIIILIKLQKIDKVSKNNKRNQQRILLILTTVIINNCKEYMQEMYRPLISIAPMIDVSNTHFRYFMRLISKQCTLYTEMIHHNAIMHHHHAVLPFNNVEHPVVLQLGGCDPQKLADAAEWGVKYGYDEINLNVGCPSPKVQEGSFGACLMKQPQIVYNCMRTVRERIKGTPCTVKCRLGVDQFDSYQFAHQFIQEVSKQGNVDHFIIHARKAFLKGLNPAQNRNIPPLMYDRVYKLQEDFPHLKFTINGGIKTLAQAKQIIDTYNVHGCMIGRTAYENPYQMIQTDNLIYQKQRPIPTREQLLYQYADYVDRVQNFDYFNGVGPVEGDQNQAISSLKHHYVNPSTLVKPLINLYHGQRFCAKYRQFLSDLKRLKNEPLGQVIRSAADFMKKNEEQFQARAAEKKILQKQLINKQKQSLNNSEQTKEHLGLKEQEKYEN